MYKQLLMMKNIFIKKIFSLNNYFISKQLKYFLKALFLLQIFFFSIQIFLVKKEFVSIKFIWEL